ncbi:hypothetical protein [Amycolatopsis tolypomycina]|uniref:hypothetical protein n=1 Tax=Amycolatopsis tolypomycina TaxID=208445 RepID=UPI0033B8F26C
MDDGLEPLGRLRIRATQPIRLSGRQNGKATAREEIDELARDLVGKGVPVGQAAALAPLLHLDGWRKTS